MKNNFAVSCFAIILFWSCSGKRDEAHTAEIPKSSSGIVYLSPDSINPNGTSELALLMRQMTGHGSLLKTRIEKGEPLDTFPESFRKIQTAIPTDSTVHSPVFSAFADHYLSSLEKLYNSSGTEHSNTFNAVVNSCVNCHNLFCTGPLKRIKTLAISN